MIAEKLFVPEMSLNRHSNYRLDDELVGNIAPNLANAKINVPLRYREVRDEESSAVRGDTGGVAMQGAEKGIIFHPDLNTTVYPVRQLGVNFRRCRLHRMPPQSTINIEVQALYP